MNMYADDFKLLADCINGIPEAWMTFIKRFSRLVYHSITHTFKLHSYSFRNEDIEDMYSGIFLSLIENDFRKLRQFESRDGCSLSSWIRIISVRHTIDFLRSQKNHLSINGEEGATRPLIETLRDNRDSAELQLEKFETEKAFRDAINELPASDRLFIRLYYEKELSDEEVADILHVSINTIYSKKNRIREKIKKVLSEQGYPARNED